MTNPFRAVEIGVCKECDKEVELVSLVNKCRCGSLNFARHYSFIPYADIDNDLEDWNFNGEE